MSVRVPLSLIAALMLPGLARAERLPSTVIPEHYDLTISTDLAAATFSGDVRIRIRLAEATRQVTLNALDLAFDQTRLLVGERDVPVTLEVDSASETATLETATAVGPGAAELRIAYHAPLNRRLRGLYLSESRGHRFAITQLEATDARRMFPSFDEPVFKASFTIRAIVGAGDTAISNGAVVSVEPGPAPDRKTVSFAETKPISSYLVALAVGPFECSAPTGGDVPVRVCASPGNGHLTNFSVDSAVSLIRYYNAYFGPDYPFGKLDIIAAPDFAAGAMENPGAMVFRERLVLLDADQASPASRATAFSVMAHELAHQWFGDLVTLAWWDDVWLNEGFATWMAAKATSDLHPGEHLAEDEIRLRQSALNIDARRSTRAIRTEADTPAEIHELFDPIAYRKGGAVLRMVEHYVGAEAFRAGINVYLEAFAYRNATTEDFASTLSKATGRPVDRIVASFVLQPGVPLLTVTSAQEGTETRVTVSQARYSATPLQPAQPWTIPVCFAYEVAHRVVERCEILEREEQTFVLPDRASWLFANASGAGYYRTFASSSEAAALAAAPSKPEERFTLAADEAAFVRSGARDVGAYLSIVEALSKAPSTAPLLAVLDEGLSYVREYFTTPETRPLFEGWVRTRFAALGRSADASDQRLRAERLELLGATGRDLQLLEEARREIAAILEGRGAVRQTSPAVLDAYAKLAAHRGDEALFEQYRRRFEGAQEPQERDRFVDAMADFENPAIVPKVVDYAFSTAVRVQDKPGLIASLLNNPAARDITWDALREHWDTMAAQFGSYGGATVIVESLGSFCDSRHLGEIRQFFTDHPTPAAARTLTQALDRIEQCATTSARQRLTLTAALAPKVARGPR